MNLSLAACILFLSSSATSGASIRGASPAETVEGDVSNVAPASKAERAGRALQGGDAISIKEYQHDLVRNFNGTEAGGLEWAPGNEAEPMDDSELEEMLSHIPGNSILKDMSAKPGKGLGRNNLKALVNSGKPFLLNGLDDDLRANLEEEMQLKLGKNNQPYMLAIPKKGKGGQVAFHFIEAVAPHYNSLEGTTMQEKRRNFLRDFLAMADQMDSKAARDQAPKNDDGRKLGDAAVPTRTYRHTAGPYKFDYTLIPEPINLKLDVSEYWESADVAHYKTSNGHDIRVIHEGHWSSNFYDDDEMSGMGVANGHSTAKITPPSGYSIYDYAPKNVNGVTHVSETKTFALSGTVGCGTSGGCTGGVGAGYTDSTTMSYDIKDWEILANGYGQWDFKQNAPFRVNHNPTHTDTFSCWWVGGCLHRPPGLSRGNFSFQTITMLTGGSTGFKEIKFQNTGRSYYYDIWTEGLLRKTSWTYLTNSANTGRWVYVG
jgi:hypothetical protein